MEQKRLRLYKLDMKYIRDLAKKDDNVHSVSPQVGKDNRPFVGIIIVCDNKKYCIPLSSPKPKHQKMKNDIELMKDFLSLLSYALPDKILQKVPIIKKWQ